MSQALPLAWRQFQDQPRRMGRDALDHIAQIQERIDLQVLAGLDERTQDGGAMGGRFAPGEEPVFAAQHRPRVILPMSVFVSDCTTGGTRWVGAT